MPLVNLFTSAEPLPASDADDFLKDVSKTVAEVLGKPERYVMTCLVPQTRMTFGGTTEPSCYVEIKSIGSMSSASTGRLSAELCPRIQAALKVPSTRIYIEFADAKPHLWGFDGKTFG